MNRAAFQITPEIEITIERNHLMNNPGWLFTCWWTRGDHIWHYTSTVCRDEATLTKRALNFGQRVAAGKVDIYQFSY